MPHATGDKPGGELLRFIESIPSPDAIRDRIERCRKEILCLRRLLKLSVEAASAGIGGGL